MIEAVVFDMDGIIFDTESLSAQAWKYAGLEIGRDVAEMHPQAMGMNADRIKQLFQDTYGDEFPYDVFRQNIIDYTDNYIAKHGLPVKPGLYELLDYLKQNGYKIAAASSTRRDCVMEYFNRAKITEYFDEIICGDMLEKSKPDPDIYLKAAGALKIEPRNCMALEDSPNGLNSAYRAGMKTVMVPDLIRPTPELQKLLFACVPSLNEVIPLLEQYKVK
jgi:HAD superfamily hydrolase (TIGR01509 family)